MDDPQEKDKETRKNPVEDSGHRSPVTFWSSRGNMGEKINVLISLNLFTLDLLSTLIQTLKENEILSTDVDQELTFFQEFLSKIIANPESTPETYEKLKSLIQKI